MKKYLLILMMTMSSWATFGQTTTTSKSEKSKFYVKETDETYELKANFSTERSKKFFDILKNYLGLPTDDDGKFKVWKATNYSAAFTQKSFNASLDKANASTKQLTSFKKLTEELQAALGQAKTPTPPPPIN
jgi:hypothetical protein